MKKIVISAVALQSGGTLSILQDCLQELNKQLYADAKIYVLIKNKDLAGGIYPRFEFIELDGARSYWRKFYYEYFYFNKISRILRPDIWISLHDVTPNVQTETQVVYCHNPAIFYRISFTEFFLDPKYGMFTLFYGFLYRMNIRKNRWIIVQQEWIREEFAIRFKVPKERIIVAHPAIFVPIVKRQRDFRQEKVFFYPTYPRVFKNIEIIGQAVAILNARGVRNFKVMLTVDGNENGYSRWLKLKFGRLSALEWIGTRSREEVYSLYDKTDCLIFPSKLETWGLPITEFKPTGRPILVAARPYSVETIGDYDKAIYFDPFDAVMLADLMEKVISGNMEFSSVISAQSVTEPNAIDWTSLFKIILEKR